MAKKEKTKLKKIKPPFEVVEFGGYEFGTAIATFAVNLQEMLKHESKFARFRVEIKAFRVLRVRKKHDAKN